mgnify:CR=1 FL=1
MVEVEEDVGRSWWVRVAVLVHHTTPDAAAFREHDLAEVGDPAPLEHPGRHVAMVGEGEGEGEGEG